MGRTRKNKDVAKSVELLRARPTEAQRLVDKNSRTLAKLVQLLEVAQRPGAEAVDKDGVVMRYVDKLKSRLNRRLLKLSKWADLTHEERLPRVKKSDPRLASNNGTYVPPPLTQYVGAVVFPSAPAAHLSELGPSDPSGPGPRGTLRDLRAPQVCIVKPSDLPSIEELMSQPAPAGTGQVFRFIPNGQPLTGFGEPTWKDYSEMVNIGTYCCVWENQEFHIGPVTESHGAVVRVGGGDKGRISLNKIVFRSPPFEKPDNFTRADGVQITAKEAALIRVREMFEQLTKHGWPAGPQRAAISAMDIPEEKVKRFKGMVTGHPENMRSSVQLRR